MSFTGNATYGEVVRKCSGLVCAGCTLYGICDREIDPIRALIKVGPMLAEVGLENPENVIKKVNEVSKDFE